MIVCLSACFGANLAGAQIQGQANLPSGAQVVAGQAQIRTQGNVLTVQQGSALLATDWRSFSIGTGHTVNFVQPSSTSVALNRVVGNEVSRIQGALNANGQVFLLNPNGVLFSPTAQVNVGALVASTLKLDNSDFLAGRYRFAGESSNAVINQGQILAASGGTVALIAAKIDNSGSILAPKGRVLMGAGSKLTLDMGGPVKLKIEQAAMDALIEQGGAIRADGGLVYLTAKAANRLSQTVINHTGVTEARTLSEGESGKIFLMGEGEQSRVLVGGRLDAGAPQGGAGGFIETSAARVDFKQGRTVSTLSTNGPAGTWLIDPNDFIIAASGGNITGTQLGSDLNSGNVVITTATQGNAGGNGDIHVNEAVTWSANKLSLTAERNINVNADLNASGSASLAFIYGQATSNGAGAGYTVATGVKVLIPTGAAFTWKKGSGGATKNLVLDNGLLRFGNGSENSIDTSGQLRQPFYFDNVTPGRNGWYQMTFSNYPLDIGVGVGGDGSNSWNYSGTVKTTQDSFNTALSDKSINIAGFREGLGTITSSASLNMGAGQLIRVENSYELLAGNRYIKTDTQLTNLGGGALSNLRLWVGTRDDYVGQGDSSYKSKGNIVSNAFVALPTQNTASNALKVAENNDGTTGGAVLFYSTSDGVDMAHAGCCQFSNSSNKDPRTSLINSTRVDGSYAMYKRLVDLSSGQSAGFVWYYAGAPVSLLSGAIAAVGQAAGGGSTPIYLRLNPSNSVYGDQLSFSYSLFDANSGGNLISDAAATGTAVWSGAPSATSNAGTYSLTYASGVTLGNAAYSLSAGAATTWNISPRTLNLSVSKVYDGNSAMTSAFALTGMSNGDASPSVSGTATLASKQVGSYTGFASSNLVLSNSNYSLSGGTVTARITPKPLTASFTASDKVYDANTLATVVAGSADLIANDTASLGYSAANFANANAGSAKTVLVTEIALSGADAGNYALQNTTATALANVSARPITVTADSKSKVYGNTDPALTWQVSGGSLLGEDTLTGGLTRAVGSNVGSYAIDASTLANSNYAVTARNGALTINARPISVSADAKSKVYGDVDPALTWQISSGNLVGDDALTGSLSRVAGSNVGSYAIDASGLSNSNYSVTPLNAALTISARPITVVADAKNKVYGNPDPALTWQVSSGSLVGSDTLDGALMRAVGESIGSHVINAQSLNNSNYAITAINADLSITPAVNANAIAGNTPSATAVVALAPSMSVPSFSGGAFILVDASAPPAASSSNEAAGTSKPATATPAGGDVGASIGSTGGLRMLVLAGGIRLPDLPSAPTTGQESRKEQ